MSDGSCLARSRVGRQYDAHYVFFPIVVCLSPSASHSKHMDDEDDERDKEKPKDKPHVVPSWTFVAAMATDKVMLKKLLEDDEDYIDPVHVQASRRLISKLMCVVAHLRVDGALTLWSSMTCVVVWRRVSGSCRVCAVCRLVIASKEKNKVEQFLLGKPRIVHLCYRIVLTKWFENFIIGVIVGNTVTLSMDYYGITQDLQNNLATANIVFSTIFGLEMVLKLTGGFRIHRNRPGA